VTVTVFVDHTMAEGFWQGGRVAMTRQVDGEKAAAAMALYSDGSGVEVEAETWAVEDCWISKEELLATPRLDGELGAVQ
jgi:sucrose-6-phosphate hydrolase SacC (GH32 family)